MTKPCWHKNGSAAQQFALSGPAKHSARHLAGDHKVSLRKCAMDLDQDIRDLGQEAAWFLSSAKQGNGASAKKTRGGFLCQLGGRSG